ncbi:hypothetical protein [Staphylococcus pseudintermedius]|uniref:hypothetical protein n=1 Tax=Staphylococcus pseudintermedius TaxID=283734 RepID=UPI0037A79A2D
MVEKTLSELEKAMLKEEHIDVSTDLTLSIKLDILNQDYKIEYKRQDKYVQFCLNKNAQLYSFSEGKWFFNL